MPVSVHRGISMSDTCWGCDFVFVGVENGCVHPMCQPHFGFPQPMPEEQCCRACAYGEAVDVVLPSLNRATKHCQPQPTSSPTLGTQFLPTSFASSL